jgi:hypothetical protein
MIIAFYPDTLDCQQFGQPEEVMPRRFCPPQLPTINAADKAANRISRVIR